MAHIAGYRPFVTFLKMLTAGTVKNIMGQSRKVSLDSAQVARSGLAKEHNKFHLDYQGV